jgi:hypothetical protein
MVSTFYALFCAAYSGQILLYNLDEVWLSYSSKDLRERIPFSPKIPGLFSNSYKPIPNELINQCIQTQFFVFGFYSQKFENNLSVSQQKKKKIHTFTKKPRSQQKSRRATQRSLI